MPVNMEGMVLSSTTDSADDVKRAAGIAVEEPKDVETEEPEVDSEIASEEVAEDTESEPKKKGKGGFLKRIDKLTRRAKESETRAEAAERRLAEVEARLAKPAESATPAKVASDGRPQLKDFESPEEWGEALTDWKLDQRDQKARKAAEEEESRESQRTYSERLEKFKASVEDWDDVADEIREKGIKVPARVEVAIRESELGPALVYHLAKNPDIVEKLNAMSQDSAVRELGKIEAKLTPETKDAPETKPKTKAPIPITPVGGMSKRTASADDPNISVEEYRAVRLAQRRGR